MRKLLTKLVVTVKLTFENGPQIDSEHRPKYYVVVRCNKV